MGLELEGDILEVHICVVKLCRIEKHVFNALFGRKMQGTKDKEKEEKEKMLKILNKTRLCAKSVSKR